MYALPYSLFALRHRVKWDKEREKDIDRAITTKALSLPLSQKTISTL